MKQNRRDFLKTIGWATAGALTTGCGLDERERPNIILILVDDMGFSDLGCYGSEIPTPHIDHLAKNGIRFTNFYNAARCCPTRASLLTGLYPHQAGVGAMVVKDPGTVDQGPYQGYLNRKSVTLAEVLKKAGYHTFMSGKWHVGELHPHWPMDRGFDDYYGIISGGANYFDIRKTKAPGIIRHFARGNEEYMPPTENWYMTDAISNHAVRMLDHFGKKSDPFFLYLSYTAPHWPLHAWPEDIAKFRGKYLKGWDTLREERFRRQLSMQLFDKPWQLTERDPIAPAWNNLDAKKKEEMDLKMAVYAAQIDCLDRGIGKVMAQLNKLQKVENTLVMFLSDNGGCAEGGPFGMDFWKNGVPPGGKNGYHNYGLSWANASNTPFRKYKQYTHEGGITTPFIARWPAVIKNEASMVHQPAHIIDIMTTFCELSGATYPEHYKGNPIIPTQGKSLIPIFRGRERQPHAILCWEHIGSVAIRKGKWKLVAAREEKWELYDLSSDRTEMINLITKYTKKAEELHSDWMAWAQQCGVKITDIHRKILI
jgi:arylsulfatase